MCDFVIATDRSRWGMPRSTGTSRPAGAERHGSHASPGGARPSEWNLLGALFDAQTAERYDLINRICVPAELDAEVAALAEVILAKHPATLRRTKSSFSTTEPTCTSPAHSHFEVPGAFPDHRDGLRHSGESISQGIKDFTNRDARENDGALLAEPIARPHTSRPAGDIPLAGGARNR